MAQGALSVKYYRHDPATTADAMILLIHGLGEHAGRYDAWVERFTSSGVGVWLFDLPGHGLSGGKRGTMPHFSEVYDIIDSQIGLIKMEHPGVPLFLYGHSLGGNIVLGFLVNRRPAVSGAIVTSPWIRLTEKPPVIKEAFSRLLNMIIPSVTLSSGLDSRQLSHDDEVVRRYNSDPLVHSLISPRLFCEAEKAADEILKGASAVDLPLLLVHGRDDRITSPTATIEVASSAPNAILKLWDDSYHELHNEAVSDDHFTFIREWIDTII